MGDLLTPLSLHARDLVVAEHASARHSVVAPPNICPLTAPFLFSWPFTDGVPALSCPFTARLYSIRGWWREHFGGHSLRRRNALPVCKTLLQPVLETQGFITLIHSAPQPLIKRDSVFLFACAIAPDKRLGNFHPSALGNSGNCHFWKGLIKSQTESPAEHLKHLPKPCRTVETLAVPGKHFYWISSRQIKHTSG